MDIQVAVLCDAATDNSGKLNILGTFDTIYTSQLPAIHPQCSIALRLVFSKMEEGHKDLKLNFVDEDGKLVMPSIDIPVDITVPDDTSFISRNFIINIQQLRFERPGLYGIDGADGRLTVVPVSASGEGVASNSAATIGRSEKHLRRRTSRMVSMSAVA